jgi:hypothetical protein
VRSRPIEQRWSRRRRWGVVGRRVTIALAAALALAAAGIAIAGQGPATTTLVSATFSANAVADSRSEACTGANNNAYTITDAVYTGTASSGDTRLAGPLMIRVRSVYDSTTNIGSVVGELEIAGTSPSQPELFRATLSAVDVNGSLQGYLIGTGASGGRFLGSFSSTFSAGSGFASSSSPGTIGSGGSTNTAVITTGGCAPSFTPSEPGQGTTHGSPPANPGSDGGGSTTSGHDHGHVHGRQDD